MDTEECCTGQSCGVSHNGDNKMHVYSFSGKWYACINGQLKLIPQQCVNRDEALNAARAMMLDNAIKKGA